VQLGIWLLAMRSFRFVIAVDRDSCMKNEPTEFRTLDAAREHVRRVLQERRSEWYAALNRPGIFDKEGNLILQQ
jgi:hypothetical protein